MCQKTLTFFISIAITTYQAILCIVGHFLPVFGLKNCGAPQISVHKDFIGTDLVFKVQRSTPSHFRVISKSITFWYRNGRFHRVLGFPESPIPKIRPRTLKMYIHTTFVCITMLSPKSNFLGLAIFYLQLNQISMLIYQNRLIKNILIRLLTVCKCKYYLNTHKKV